MRSWSSLLHVCAGMTLTLALFVLLNNVHGDLPPCDGTLPSDLVACPNSNGSSCPNVGQADCIQPGSQCGVIQSISTSCKGGGSKTSQLCQVGTNNVPCVINYYCYFGIPKGGTKAQCLCGTSKASTAYANGATPVDCATPKG